MGVLRNLLAVIGLLFVIIGGVAAAIVMPVISEFDPGFKAVYMDFASKLLASKDPGTAMVWSVPVEDANLSVEDVKESMKSIASANNFLFVGEAPFYKQVQALTGKPYRHVEFLSFCDAGVGKMMADYNDAYTAFMPCRIAIVQDKQGKLWLHSMNIDMMIYGGKTLPPDLKEEAIRVSEVIKKVMHGAAKGEF